MSEKLVHEIRHLEKVAPGYWEASGLTEDGHRLSGIGCTAKQAVYKLHEAAKSYGEYEYPK